LIGINPVNSLSALAVTGERSPAVRAVSKKRLIYSLYELLVNTIVRSRTPQKHKAAKPLKSSPDISLDFK
tara:strand:- start:141 stop:350 length:210 start_codon:yes stop_codon:yes gene_type:complete